MPLLVRLTDSEIEVINGVVSQVADGVDDERGIAEQVGAVGLAIHEKPFLPDLDVEPVHWDVQRGGHFRGAEEAGIVVPAGPLHGHFDAGAEPEPLHGDRQDLVCAVGRTVPLGAEDCGDLVVGDSGAGEVERTIAHLLAVGQMGDGVDPQLHRDVADGSTAPHDPDEGDVALAAIENDPVDKAAQQRLALRIRGRWIRQICGSRPVRTTILSLSDLPIIR